MRNSNMVESQSFRKINMFGIVMHIKPVLKRYLIDSCIRRNDSHVLFASLSNMKWTLLFIVLFVSPLISQDNLVERPQQRLKIMIANAAFGKAVKDIDRSKLEAAVTLAAALSSKLYLLPGSALDSAARVLKSKGIEPTAIMIAKELSADEILFFNINQLEKILRVGVTSVSADSAQLKKEGEGWAAIRYLYKEDDRQLTDPALLSAVQRAFADMYNDSLMYDKAEGSFRVFPAEPTVIGAIDFINDDDLPLWEMFEAKEVYSFDAIETIFSEAIKIPFLVTYDMETRDSVYAKFGLYIVENFNAPSSLELEILEKINVKYYITGNLKRVDGGSFVELFFCELYKGKLNILRSAEGILTKDSMDEMRKLLKKLSDKLFLNDQEEK
jgi:uncharacterized protein YkuJ